MNVVKLKRYVGVVLVCPMLVFPWMDNRGYSVGKPRLTFLDNTNFSSLIHDLSFDYKLISAFHRFDIECSGYKVATPHTFTDERCSDPELWFYSFDEINRIVESSKELTGLRESLNRNSPDEMLRYRETLSKVAGDYAKSRINYVKTLTYAVHVGWVIFFLIALKFREKIGGTTLHALRKLFVSVSGLFKAIRRLFVEIHNRI